MLVSASPCLQAGTTPVVTGEKAQALKGQAVTVVDRKPRHCAWASIHDVERLDVPRDKKGRPREAVLASLGSYVGQTGTVFTIDEQYAMPRVGLDLGSAGRIMLDADKVVAQSALDAARALVGRTVWARAFPVLLTDLQICEEHTRPKPAEGPPSSPVQLRNLEPVQVTDVRLGGSDHPIYVYVTTERGGSGWLEGEFHSSNPRELHPGWDPKTWAAIEEGRIEVGMDLEMARLACGETVALSDFAFNFTEGATEGRFVCLRRRAGGGGPYIPFFQVEAGKVTRLIEE
jgi:hypothetical protein